MVHPFSDIDIGIYLKKSINRKDYLKIELQVGLKLDEILDCGAKSEVRIINALPLMIRGEIIIFLFVIRYSAIIYLQISFFVYGTTNVGLL